MVHHTLNTEPLRLTLTNAFTNTTQMQSIVFTVCSNVLSAREFILLWEEVGRTDLQWKRFHQQLHTSHIVTSVDHLLVYDLNPLIHKKYVPPLMQNMGLR